MRSGTSRRRCPSDGELRALLDGKGLGDECLDQHASDCAQCASRVHELRIAKQVAHGALTTNGVSMTDVDVSAAMARVMARSMNGNRRHVAEVDSDLGGRWMGSFWMRRGARTSTAVVAVIVMVVALAVSPMRTVADDLLNQFRVQKFAAVTIPMNLVEPLQSGMLQNMAGADKERMEQELGELGTFETTFQLDLSSLPTPTTLEDAEARFGDIAVPDDLPEGFGEPTVYVTDAGSASYELNVGKAQEIIDELGLPIYAFDQVTSDTLTFTATVSEASVMRYQSGLANIIVGQTASPTLDIPENFDMDALREDILRFPGLPTDLVAQLRAIDDWESTLIVPIPENAQSRDVTVNGNAGLLVEMDLGAVVLWEDGGVLFAVAGQVSGDQALDIADSMD